MENGDETLASPTDAVAAEKAAPNGVVAGEEVTVTAHAHPAKSYATVAAEKTSPNGSAAGDEVTVTAPKSYAAVAANAEIEDLRATKLDLEEKLAAADQENKALAAETHRLEGIFSQAREEVATAEYAAVFSDEVVVSLRDEVKLLQDLLKAEKGDREEDKRNSEQLAAKVEAERQVKLMLEKEIEALKKKAADTTSEEREADPTAEAPEEAGVAWPGMAAAAAAGAVATAAVLLLYLRLKR